MRERGKVTKHRALEVRRPARSSSDRGGMRVYV